MPHFGKYLKSQYLKVNISKCSGSCNQPDVCTLSAVSIIARMPMHQSTCRYLLQAPSMCFNVQTTQLPTCSTSTSISAIITNITKLTWRNFCSSGCSSTLLKILSNIATQSAMRTGWLCCNKQQGNSKLFLERLDSSVQLAAHLLGL